MNGSLSTKVLAIVIFVATLASVVILTVMDKPTADILTLAGPVVAAVFVTSAVGKHIETRTEPLESKINRVERQTNGALDRKFALVHARLDSLTLLMETFIENKDKDKDNDGEPADRA